MIEMLIIQDVDSDAERFKAISDLLCSWIDVPPTTAGALMQHQRSIPDCPKALVRLIQRAVHPLEDNIKES